MASELTGILTGTGAKMKAEVGDGLVAFRGAVKAEVPFEEIVAEARGTLLVLSFRGHVVELGAGARAGQLAARIRSPPSLLDRLGIPDGVSCAVAGPIPSALRSEVAARTVMAEGVPKAPVEALFFAVESVGQLDPLARLAALVAPGGSLWVVFPGSVVPAAKVAAAGAQAGCRPAPAVRLSATHSVARLQRP